MSIATFESRQVASQRFFPWVFDEDADCDYSETEPAQDFAAETEVVCQLSAVPACIPSSATETRLGMPVRLGAVMLKLLKSYGITDEEIAEGIAAYAAKARLAQAG